MAIHAATAGHYTALYGGSDLGRTEEGWFWEVIHKGELVRFEEYAQSIVDFVYQGADVFVETVLKEWNAAALQGALWPFSASFGKVECVGTFAVLGNFFSDLVLTPEACNPATQTYTFHKVIMAPEVASRINLNNSVRTIPMRFQVFLSEQGASDYQFFSVS